MAAEAQAARGCAAWHYSLDFNERCASVDYVLDFLGQLGERSPEALRRLQYIEQPTHRDLRANPENRMHRAARIKPVVIDESLVDYESLLMARELGYTGVALKACKGQSHAMLMAAAAHPNAARLFVVRAALRLRDVDLVQHLHRQLARRAPVEPGKFDKAKPRPEHAGEKRPAIPPRTSRGAVVVYYDKTEPSIEFSARELQKTLSSIGHNPATLKSLAEMPASPDK